MTAGLAARRLFCPLALGPWASLCAQTTTATRPRAAMFTGERLRADLRGLQRLCADMVSWAGEQAVEAVHLVKPVASAGAGMTAIDAQLLQAVHERQVRALATGRRKQGARVAWGQHTHC